MLRSRARAASVAAVLALGLSTLAACGGEDSGPETTGNGLESVTITGEFGEKPTVEWDGRVTVADTEVEVLVEGDGEVVADGDTVNAHWWVGNGYTQEEAQSTFPEPPAEGGDDADGDTDGETAGDDAADDSTKDKKGNKARKKGGKKNQGKGNKGGKTDEPAEPDAPVDPAASAQSIQLTKDVIKALREAMIGQKVGTRVAVMSPAEDAFGDAGNPQLGIGNKDSVLFIVDIFGKTKILDGPQGADREPAGWAPKIVEEGGVPTGFDFSGTEPDKSLKVTTLVEGDGPVVESGKTIHVNYLGQVHEGEAPFDESYSGESTSFPIGVGQVVAGWDEGLVGRTVGSRLILQIPPKKGYGKDGNEGAGIKGTDTLYFVVDILGVS